VVFKDRTSRKEAVKKIDELRGSGASQDTINAHIADVRANNYQGMKTGGRPLAIVPPDNPGAAEYQEVARGQGEATKAGTEDSGVGTMSQVSRDSSVVSSYTTDL